MEDYKEQNVKCHRLTGATESIGEVWTERPAAGGWVIDLDQRGADLRQKILLPFQRHRLIATYAFHNAFHHQHCTY